MGELLGLSWDNYRDSMTGNLKTIIRDEDFVDVSLHCEGRTLRAHKVTTSAAMLRLKMLFCNENNKKVLFRCTLICYFI